MDLGEVEGCKAWINVAGPYSSKFEPLLLNVLNQNTGTSHIMMEALQHLFSDVSDVRSG